MSPVGMPGRQRIARRGEGDALAAERADHVVEADDLVVVRQALRRQAVEDDPAAACGEGVDLRQIVRQHFQVRGRRCDDRDGCRRLREIACSGSAALRVGQADRVQRFLQQPDCVASADGANVTGR